MAKSKRVTLMSDDLFGFAPAELEFNVTKYASGVLSPAIWEGYRKAGNPMCIAASETGEAALARACDFVRAGGQLLVDSGAFIYRENPDATPWRRIVSVYQAIAQAATVPVAFILPDVVGNQEKTLAALREWGNAIQSVVSSPHELLMPVQLGDKTPGNFVREALLCLERPMDGLALPSNAAAFPPTMIPMLADMPDCVPHRLHFLGISRNSHGLQERLFRLQAIWPDASVSCDACEHRALVGANAPITKARADALTHFWDHTLESWDDTEDDDTTDLAREALRERFPDLDDDDLDALMCSGWGTITQTAARHRQHEKHNGPKATTESIYRYATGTL